MYVWYHIMIWHIRRITLTCNTAALMPRAVCSSLRSPVQQWKNMRTVPFRSEKKKCTARAVEKKRVSSLRVVEEIIYRPVPSWKIICTVPSRRAKKYIPSRPVVTIFIYRPVPSWNKQKGYCTVPTHPVQKINTHRPVSSHSGNYIILPSRFQIFPRQTCQNNTDITSHKGLGNNQAIRKILYKDY